MKSIEYKYTMQVFTVYNTTAVKLFALWKVTCYLSDASASCLNYSQQSSYYYEVLLMNYRTKVALFNTFISKVRSDETARRVIF
jgi:hypothetical protein